MTCIVGIEEGDCVWLGGDSAGSDGQQIVLRADPKVFANGAMLFGYTTSFRMGQLLRFSLKIPEQPRSKGNYEYLCTDFVAAVIKCLKDHQFAHVTYSVVSGGTFLMGYKGRLYYVDSDYQIGQSLTPYSACGCGENFALGSLYSTANKRMKPEVRLKAALNAAAYHSAGVSAPFKIIKQDYKNE